MNTVVPYKDRQDAKKQQVADMFNNISSNYDLLNRVLSAGIDVRWRKKAIKMLKPYQPKLILDVATGTADLAIEALSLQPEKIIGIDISEGMLEFGRKKLVQADKNKVIELMTGDSENLPFADATFDAVMVSFGVRNFENLEKGLTEIYRTLKKGGVLLVLEFSKPKQFPIKQFYGLYSQYILPFIGKTISKDSSAYTYLPESVAKFPEGKDFTNILEKIGFHHTQCTPLTFGISSIYIGQK
jgi:demethylmenaquinone methyltransferase/2-methoxy-6-polyprenyl-1,4-benzoquinol methylase